MVKYNINFRRKIIKIFFSLLFHYLKTDMEFSVNVDNISNKYR